MAESSRLTNKELSVCRKFLTRLSRDEVCAFTTYSSRWAYTELEGEIIDLLFRFLRTEECPIILLSPLVKEVKQNLLNLDLDGYKHPGSDCFNPTALCKLLLDVFKTVCSSWQTDPNALVLKDIQQPTHVSVHSIRNARRKMEDQHSYYEDINTLFGFDDVTHGQSLFAVFDGHGGAEAADFAASQLICELKSCDNMIPQPGESLKHAILNVDSKFSVRAGVDTIKSGCTLVAVLIQGMNLTVAWCGDSQAVLCKDSQAIQLMDPHKPERPDEKSRIEGLGGLVLYMNGWRVNGQLAVSRAIGDVEHKPYVSSEAEFEEYEMEGDEEFLILACDGLWDVVEPTIAVECVQKCVEENRRDSAAESLVQMAKDNNSLDNITVLVAYLDFNKS